MTYNLQSYIERLLTETLRWSLANFSVTALLGPRQCGKSTLARHVVEDYEDAVFIDLEKPSDLRKLEDAEFFFHTQKEKLLCIDEVQRRPELFPLLRVVVDEDRRPGKFLILGSASPDLIRHGSETLAGRIHFLELTPFTYDELVVADRLKYQDPARIWVRGGFPESVLAVNENVSLTWRQDFIRTFLERDIPQFGFSIPATTMRRFWVMLAHFHGQVFNASKLGQSLGVTHPTIRKYLDIMEQTYMVRILLPLAANLKKRLVKSPKIYIRDSGILHALLEIRDIEEGKSDKTDNPIKNAPHTAKMVTSDNWEFPYSRQKAAYPVEFDLVDKYFAPVTRIDDAWGDRNLICTCIPISEYKEESD